MLGVPPKETLQGPMNFLSATHLVITIPLAHNLGIPLIDGVDPKGTFHSKTNIQS